MGLHPAFEVYIIDERSFFAAMLITTPNDLLQYKSLSLAYMDWRHKNNKNELKLQTIKTRIKLWKDAMIQQGTANTTSTDKVSPASTLESERPTKRIRTDTAVASSEYSTTSRSLGFATASPDNAAQKPAFDAEEPTKQSEGPDGR